MKRARELRLRGRSVTIEEPFFEPLVRALAPIRAARRYRARLFQALAGSYTGASSKRSLRSWTPKQADADTDLVWDLQTLRDRSRDLIRNEPLASGAINTNVTNVVGTGLTLQARVDRDILGLTEEEADAWETTTEREFSLFAESVECDAERRLVFVSQQELVFRSALESGDCFILVLSVERPGSPYRTKLQVVEADRITNPGYAADRAALIQGVEKDSLGAPVAYHILTTHPGSLLTAQPRVWQRVPAFGEQTGRRMVLQLAPILRPGQTRGVPYLAPVIDPLKQLGRYTEAELMASVVSGLFTVFIKSELGDLGPMQPTDETGGSASDADLKLAGGAIVGLAPGEDISAANPGRPNTAFDPFVQAVLRQIGVALELPYEVLVKHFTASYSAARAALLEAWKFFRKRREWLAVYFCQPVYEAWMWEAVALGRIHAPGFLSDPLLRKAYLGADWVGPAKGMIDELNEVKAARERVEGGLSTLDQETVELTGGDWERNHRQQVKEKKRRLADGLEAAAIATGQAGDPSMTDPGLDQRR